MINDFNNAPDTHNAVVKALKKMECINYLYAHPDSLGYILSLKLHDTVYEL